MGNLFKLFNGLWQIIKAYPEEVKITKENASDFMQMGVAFTEPYRNTKYERLAIALFLAYSDFKEIDK